jgi:hypothetical protein
MVTDLIDRWKWHLLEARPDGEAWRTDTGLTVIYSTALEQDGREWLHVSASRVDRIPSYSDMTRVKNAFIGVHRTAYSVWVPASEHVNIHPNCLHLWAVLEGDDPLPDFTRGTGSI